jgi:hypothetical protein
MCAFGSWHSSRKKVSIAGLIWTRAAFAQPEACYAAKRRLGRHESHKDGSEPYKTVERRAIQRYAVLCDLPGVVYDLFREFSVLVSTQRLLLGGFSPGDPIPQDVATRLTLSPANVARLSKVASVMQLHGMAHRDILRGHRVWLSCFYTMSRGDAMSRNPPYTILLGRYMDTGGNCVVQCGAIRRSTG